MRRWGLLLLGIWSALAIASPVAGAEIQRPSTSGFVHLGSAGGYEIALLVRSDRVAELDVFRPLQQELGGYARASYAVRPTAGLGSGVLRTSFGPVGRVSLRFHPSGRRKVLRGDPRCTGKRPVVEWGFFRGSVELRGEGNYFEVVTKTAKGTRKRTFSQACRRGHAVQPAAGPLPRYVTPSLGFGSSGSGLMNLLRVGAEVDGRKIALRATNYRRGRHDEVSAGTLESLPDLAIGRQVTLYAPVGPLQVSPGVEPPTAFLRPYTPFAGEASYAESSTGAAAWTGPLAVDLPGLHQPLTGPAFSADLCRSEPRTRASCAAVDEPLAP